MVLIVFFTVSLHDYFNRWANDDTVRREHQAGIVADRAADRSIARRSADRLQQRRGDALESVERDGVSSHRPDRLYGRPAGSTPDRAFIFPQGQTDLTLINAALDDQPAPLDGRLIEDLFPVVEPIPTASDVYSATHLVSSLNTRLHHVDAGGSELADRDADQPIGFIACRL